MLIILAAAGFAFCAEDFTCDIDYKDDDGAYGGYWNTKASYFNDSLVLEHRSSVILNIDICDTSYYGKFEGMGTAIIRSAKTHVSLKKIPVKMVRTYDTYNEKSCFLLVEFSFRIKVSEEIISLSRHKVVGPKGSVVHDDGLDCLDMAYNESIGN